ncbi:hypothetical protein TWF694_002363 [Orbilia ellipsospora]|uniref:Uncharacterized protein n=1 Tax=Orbilia ellipsospora TaxID=2528407 RepID=A0AAV9X337_9PEZI
MASLQSPEITMYGEENQYSRPNWMHQASTTSSISIQRKPVPYQSLETPIDIETPSPKESPREEKPPQSSRWGVTWQTPAVCLTAFFSAFAIAIGNHVYFSGLNNKPYENSVWIGRYALVLALIVKTCFATCIIICYEQFVWMGFRRRQDGTSIRAIDALFGSTYQVVSLFYPAIWIQHPVAALLIAIRWLLPLVSIVAPTTLTVQIREAVTYSDCQVPTLNFSVPNQASVLSTSPNAYLSDLAQSDYTENEWFATSLGSKVGTLTGFLGQPVSYSSPCGNNCSYSITFNAPIWRCTDVDPHNATAPWEVMNTTEATWATNNIGNEIQYTSLYKYYGVSNDTTGRLWVGHLIYKNVTNPKKFWDSWDVETFYCDSYNTSVSVEQAFLNGEQLVPQVQKLEYGNQINLTIGQGWAMDNNVSWVELGRHQVVYQVLSGLFLGSVYEELRAGRDFTNLTTVLDMSSFVQSNSSQAGQLVSTIRPLAEQLSFNYSMSLLSYPELALRQMTTANCSMTTFSNVWKYEKTNLILAYALGMAIALVSLILGGIALAQNGVVSEISFSQIMATTRNPELDHLLEGNCLGRSDLGPRELYRTRLRFGEIKQQDSKLPSTGVAHTAFGMPENVTSIRRQGYYI